MNGAMSRRFGDRAGEFLRLRIPARFERPRGLFVALLGLLVVVTTVLVGSLYEGPWYWQIWYGFFVTFLLPVALVLGLLVPVLALAGLWYLIGSVTPRWIADRREGRNADAASSPTPSGAR
mgnify:CR=1 FL=1